MSEREGTALYKSKRFAIRIIKAYQQLCDEKREYVLSKQLLRAGTSIGANLSEAEYAVSEKDFLAKMHIALKECAETIYWLELLLETQYISDDLFSSMKMDGIELLKMLTASTKTMSNRISDKTKERRSRS